MSRPWSMWQPCRTFQVDRSRRARAVPLASLAHLGFAHSCRSSFVQTRCASTVGPRPKMSIREVPLCRQLRPGRCTSGEATSRLAPQPRIGRASSSLTARGGGLPVASYFEADVQTSRQHLRAVFAVRCKHTIMPGKVGPAVWAPGPPARSSFLHRAAG